MKFKIEKALSPNLIQQCMDIRHCVFIDGQNVPSELELDGKDPQSEHYLLTAENTSVATARIQLFSTYAKIERVAVLPSFQGHQLGSGLMQYILADLKKRPDIKQARLSSQTHAIPFYEKLGFELSSDEYIDAGIPHRDMKMEIG